MADALVGHIPGRRTLMYANRYFRRKTVTIRLQKPVSLRAKCESGVYFAALSVSDDSTSTEFLKFILSDPEALSDSFG